MPTSAFEHARMKRPPFVRWPATNPTQTGHVLKASNVPVDTEDPLDTFWAAETGGGGGGDPGIYKGEVDFSVAMPAGVDDRQNNWVVANGDASGVHPSWVFSNTPLTPIFRYSVALWDGTGWNIVASQFDSHVDAGTY